MICWYKPCKGGLKGADGETGAEAYQSDHSGSGPGARHDVQVIGQVELEEGEQQGLISSSENVTTRRALLLTWQLHERVDKRRPLTSLVLQMSPSVDPQAFPGVAFHGIIPGAMKFTGFHI